MPNYDYRRLQPADQLVYDTRGNLVGIRAGTSGDQAIFGLNEAEYPAVQALASDDGIAAPETIAYLAALSSINNEADTEPGDMWQIISATGLALPLPCFVKAAKLISGTSPTLVLRDALVDTYTSTSSSADVVADLPATVTVGDEIPINRRFRMAVHATVGGTTPVWAIKL